MEQERLYRVAFVQQDERYEVYARGVGQGEIFGFIEIEELVFGERSKVVVDPTEERVKTEFRGVHRFYVPLHSVLRIDEVETAGVSQVKPAEGGDRTVALFPNTPGLPIPNDRTPGDGEGGG